MALAIQTSDNIWIVHCPGCGCAHGFPVSEENDLAPGKKWTMEGTPDCPTFKPSLVCGQGTDHQCHMIVTDGIANFQPDCFHQFAGQQVKLPDMDS